MIRLFSLLLALHLALPALPGTMSSSSLLWVPGTVKAASDTDYDDSFEACIIKDVYGAVHAIDFLVFGM